MKDIILEFPISNEEFEDITKEFGKLAWKATHEFMRKNFRNNIIEDRFDVNQELQISMLTAGAYYKRQIYTEKCLEVAKQYAKDKFVSSILGQLQHLWDNRKRHGASRQKYGRYQEEILEKIVQRFVPVFARPNKKQRLNVNDQGFSTYCKSIVWNGGRHLGKQVSKTKKIRNSMVSLSEHDHLI